MKTPHFWQHKNVISAALTPLSWLYACGAWIDRYFTTPRHAPIPVISVGNVTAGGAGKTPTTLALIALLKEAGHTPHILTRGYKGAVYAAHRVTENDTWHSIGDEALLLAQSAPTWVGRNRFAAANAAAASGASILVCDDALQHHALYKDFSILVIDGPYGIGNGAHIPAGPLREPLTAALARADAVVIIGADTQHLAHQISLPIFTANLDPTKKTPPLQNNVWLAFAGIGRPNKFYTTLRELGANIVATHDFADHYAYREEDGAALLEAAKALGAQLITTAKDAVKLPATLAPHITVLHVVLQLDAPEQLQQCITTTLAAKTCA